MKLAVACGGTGGHVYPGLATAEWLRRDGHDVTLWLAGDAMEAAAVEAWGGDAITVPMSPIRPRPDALLQGLWRLGRAWTHCRQRLARSRPRALLAMGSYASLAPALAARSLGVPLVLHEANAVPGRAVGLLRHAAEAVAVSFAETAGHLRHRRIVETGMPIRFQPPPTGSRAAGDGRRLLVMGGSRGARRLNEVVSAAVVSAHRRGCSLRVDHLTGAADEAMVRAAYVDAGVEAEVAAFRSDVDRLYARADFAVCRAGASTCAELQAFNLPALLVPYPHAVRDHQLANARCLQRLGLADVCEERDLSAAMVTDYLVARVAKPAQGVACEAPTSSGQEGDAAARLARLVVAVAEERP